MRNLFFICGGIGARPACIAGLSPEGKEHFPDRPAEAAAFGDRKKGAKPAGIESHAKILWPRM